MIIEGLLTTSDADGEPHLAAMGPLVNRELSSWVLRPFTTSKTFQNLRREPKCVFHVTDDVLTVVRAVLGEPQELDIDKNDDVWVLRDCCHWYRLQVSEWSIDGQRSRAQAEVLAHGVERPFWGWNRAKHAILEATILASRLHILEPDCVAKELDRLRVPVEKTAGEFELQAWDLVQKYVKRWSSGCKADNGQRDPSASKAPSE